MNKRIICQKCKYYYITWQTSKPHGCKAYGFTSAILPSLVVKRSSGIDCSFFTPKFKDSNIDNNSSHY
ncbi:MAG: uracil-DNA glycosylase [Campylobacterales bacterium]|nr:uracil-DNA glycosylase [Campylobacterales bacterium]NQY52310.1 uracil-DNA glycosylase [Campylobacteraceae bacterium]